MSDDAKTLWVIVRSTGEYSDREETPIRYCLSEEEAKQAIELTSVEAQRDGPLKPTYRRESTHAWYDVNGNEIDHSFCSPRRDSVVFKQKPDAEAIEAQNDQWQQEYDAACLAFGHVDPEGSWRGDDYYYAPVTLWTPPAS